MNRQVKYSREHIWAERLPGTNRIRLGISEFAVHKLGEIIAVEFPRVGEKVRAGQSIGTVESAKTVSDLYCPVDGTVTAIHPDGMGLIPLLSHDPFQHGWIAEVDMDSPGQWDRLLDEQEYLEFLG